MIKNTKEKKRKSKHNITENIVAEGKLFLETIEEKIKSFKEVSKTKRKK